MRLLFTEPAAQAPSQGAGWFITRLERTMKLRLIVLIFISTVMYARSLPARTPDWIVDLCAGIQKEYSSIPSGIYRSRNINEIKRTRKLEGCQDWGALWMDIFTSRSIQCAYLQCVDLHWIIANPPAHPFSGWSGHVFIEAEIDGEHIIFDSTNSNPSLITKTKEGFEILNQSYVLLFRCRSPQEFKAGNEEGMRPLLVDLSMRWHTSHAKQ